MNTNDFITVGKKMSSKEKNRHNKEIHSPTKQMDNMTCNWCKEKGHGFDVCQKRKDSFNKKKETQKKMDKDFPPILVASSSKQSTPALGKEWANVAKQNRNEKMVEKINKIEEELAKKRKQEKEKAREDYLERVRLREERQKMRDIEYIAAMETRFGTKWFNWVDKIEGGKYDSNIAAKLRYEYEEEQYNRECERDDMERKAEKEAQEREERAKKEDAEMKRTLSPKSYMEWRAQKDEEESDDIDDWLHLGSMEWQRSEIDYLTRAPPLYREHYHKTCQQLNWNEKILENIELLERRSDPYGRA
jgi:hypothetical protein